MTTEKLCDIALITVGFLAFPLLMLLMGGAAAFHAIPVHVYVVTSLLLGFFTVFVVLTAGRSMQK